MRRSAVARFGAKAAIAAAVAAAVLGLWWGLSPAPDLTDRLRDDAFYEFAWAANVAAGRGPTVSDGVATSGVQLLWSLCLVPVAWLGGAAALPLVAPWLGLLLHAATAAVWLSCVRDRTAALCVGLCWLGNPLLVRECQNGQETALGCLLLALLWAARAAGEGRFAVLGGLATFARADLFGCVVALSLWRHRARPRLALATPGALLVLFLAVNRWLGGGWLPDSAGPMAWLWHANFAATGPDPAAWLRQVWWYLRPLLLGGPFALVAAVGWGTVVFALVRPWWPARWRAAPALAVAAGWALGMHDLAVPGIAAALLLLLPARRRRPVPWALFALALGSAAIVALHWTVRWYPRDYYAAPLAVAAAAAVLRFGRVRLLLLAVAVAQAFAAAAAAPEPLRGQREMQLGGRFLAGFVPPGEPAGCFNSGIATFEADVLAGPAGQARTVVNLDGVVDARSFRALRQGRLGAWLDERSVRFLIDGPQQFASDPRLAHANGQWFGGGFDARRDLVEIARFVVPGPAAGARSGGGFRLYWRQGRGPAPAPPGPPRDLGLGPGGGRCILWPAAPGQWLEAETGPGGRVPLYGADAHVAVVLLAPCSELGTGRLFVRGEPTPVLELGRP
ncbi:MAG: hypothetical protein FJ265_16675 [Planctomycetes bacterium]|nr:hypothetical protein [Planctomycetota bacterium]